MKIFLYKDYFPVDTQIKVLVKIVNSRDIQKLKTTKANFSKTWM